MKIKVCGLKNPEEIQRIDHHCCPDFVGMIFHENSPRNYEDNNILTNTNALKVGVFVDQNEEFIVEKIKRHRLEVIQLHGQETPELCYRLAALVSVIKAFSITDQFLFNQTIPYRKVCDYFLFDTSVHGKTGGTGKKFDWTKLSEYDGENPFFLSGGIGPSDVQNLQSIRHPKLVGIDINSQFEIQPGIKNDSQINEFIHNVRPNKIVHTA